MAEKFNVTGEQRDDINGQMIDIMRQLRLKRGSPIDPELVRLALQKIVEGKFAIEAEKEIVKKSPPILRRIYGTEKLMIEALDGKAYISDAGDVFKVGIDQNFKNFGLNQPGPATAEVLVDMIEIVKGGTFVQTFTSITPDLDKLVLTQAQIIYFCREYPAWFSPALNTTFLTKAGTEYFVVDVEVRSFGLAVQVCRLQGECVWRDEYRRRVVFPKLVPAASINSVHKKKDKPIAILSDIVSSSVIPARTENFIVKDKFVIDASREAKVKIAHVGNKLEEWFFGKEEGPAPASTIYGRQLNHNSVDSPILAELGGKTKAKTTMAKIYAMMECQADGKSGDLLNNGYANIFYAPDVKGVVRTVVVHWSSYGWSVRAYSVNALRGWSAGRRVFSHKPADQPKELPIA